MNAPMRSMAARLRGVWLGSWSEGGERTRYINALAVRRVMPVSRAHTAPSLAPSYNKHHKVLLQLSFHF